MKIKYVGPLDSYKFMGVTFTRLKAVQASEKVAHEAINHPQVFIVSDIDGPDDVDAEVLELRMKLADAMEAEGKERIRGYNRMLSIADNMPDSDELQAKRKRAAIEGAESEIAKGEQLQDAGREWRRKVKAELADVQRQADEQQAREEAEKAKAAAELKKAEAERKAAEKASKGTGSDKSKE
jgi:hypothetical protein